MRAFLLIAVGMAISAPAFAQSREHTVAGRLAVLHALRDARLACSGEAGDAWRRCVERESSDGFSALERTADAPLFAGPGEVRDAQSKTLGAMQAAYADCRARGIQRGTQRWEFCNIDRGIARLEEAARP